MGGQILHGLSSLMFLFYRPHVVTAKWLLECFRKGYLVAEEQYIPATYQPVDISILEHCVMKPVLPPKNSFSKKEAVNVTPAREADEDLLSQYVTNNSTAGKIHPSYSHLRCFCVPQLANTAKCLLSLRLPEVIIIEE